LRKHIEKYHRGRRYYEPAPDQEPTGEALKDQPADLSSVDEPTVSRSDDNTLQIPNCKTLRDKADAKAIHYWDCDCGCIYVHRARFAQHLSEFHGVSDLKEVEARIAAAHRVLPVGASKDQVPKSKCAQCLFVPKNQGKYNFLGNLQTHFRRCHPSHVKLLP